jgi:hypothetical protein
MQSEEDEVSEMHGKMERNRKKIKLKKYHCKDGWSQIHRLRLCRQSLDEESGVNESKSHRWLRIGIFIAICMLMVKQCCLIMFYHNKEKEGEYVIDEIMLKWFGDYFFFEPRIRKHLNIILIVEVIGPLQTQLFYHRLWRNGSMRCIPTVKLFQVFAGMRSSKELGLGCQEVIKLMKR